ncbi:MAG: hypothetical protein KME21_17085 [Desmonostoc vinosum HA7617-LM4]|nr:hypothetical protein [Desmonostoc vinosum HA7617-LM4]
MSAIIGVLQKIFIWSDLSSSLYIYLRTPFGKMPISKAIHQKVLFFMWIEFTIVNTQCLPLVLYLIKRQP